jgi:hypothetical protein
MPNYKVAVFPTAHLEDEMWVLGPEAQMIAEFDAAYPAKARELADSIVDQTRTEFTWKKQRGKMVKLTTYLGDSSDRPDMLMGWTTAQGVMALVKA